MDTKQLTFTRFIAAFAIVVFHFGLTAYPFNNSAISFLFGNIGVSYFFVLSGFVMVLAYGKYGRVIEPLTYYKNRFARVYPVYLLALIWSVRLLLVSHIPFTGKAVAMNLVLLQSWLPPYALTINRTGWTLSVETLFYLSFPFLYNHIYAKKPLFAIAVGIMLFWLISQTIGAYFNTPYWDKLAPSPYHDLIFYFPPMHLNQFLVGNLFGLIYFEVQERFSKNWDILLLILLSVIVAALKYPVAFANYHDGFLAILFATFMLFLATNTGFITKISTYKLPVFLGEISFGMYILQIPVYNTGFRLARTYYSQHYSSFFAIYMIVLIALSAISYQFIENPLRKWIRK